MKLPIEIRYPRQRQAKPPESMVDCMKKLTNWQNIGDLVFRLMEGQGLGAQTAGGFHGNNDDNDIDMTIFSRKGVEGGTLRLVQLTNLGSFGFVELPW